MNEVLHKDFGKCIVPKDCFLFRKAESEKIRSAMFFGFEVAATYSSSFKSENTQVWKVKEDIISLFPIKEITPNNWYKSSLGELCVKHIGVPSNDADYLSIKQNDNPTRRALIEFLQKNNIYSWVSDLEGRVTMELFLFNTIDEIAKKVEFKGYTNKNDPKLMDYNYYKYVKIIHNPTVNS